MAAAYAYCAMVSLSIQWTTTEKPETGLGLTPEPLPIRSVKRIQELVRMKSPLQSISGWASDIRRNCRREVVPSDSWKTHEETRKRRTSFSC